MQIKICCLLIALVLRADVYKTGAQEIQFFRIVGPTATTIVEFQSNGTLVWSNAQPGATYTIQTLKSLTDGTGWVDYVQLPVTAGVNTNLIFDFTPPAGMELIPAGSFMMGDTLDGETDAVPVSVTVSSFYMDVNIVSYSQWLRVYNWATTHGYTFDNAGDGKATNQPVQNENWYDAVKWCNARSEMESLTPAYYTDSALTSIYRSGDYDLGSTNVNWDTGYRLPTEAEWEKAARGGLTGQRFPWGNIISESQANYYGDTNDLSYDRGPNGFNSVFAVGGYPYTSPVGYFEPNDYGLYDMTGNAYVWCWDWYGIPYTGGSDPRGPTFGTVRVTRGGDWDSYASLARCAYRDPEGYPTDVMYDSLAFRCVRRH